MATTVRKSTFQKSFRCQDFELTVGHSLTQRSSFYGPQETVFRGRPQLYAKAKEGRPLDWWLSQLVRPMRDLIRMVSGNTGSVAAIYLSYTAEEGFPMTVVPISPIIEDGREWWPSAKEETLFIFEESPFPLDELVPNWLEVRRHHGPAIDLFYLSHYSDTPSPKVRFLLVFHALERFHRLSGFDQDRWDLRDYKRILAAVQNLSDLTPEQRGWVVPKLQHNEVSQRRRLTDIVKPLADVYGGVVRPNLGEFVEIIVESRNALVHQLARPAESAITDARGLDILAAVLRIFLETHLLAETGHSLDEVADRMHDTRRFKEAFSYWVPFLVQVGVL